MQAYLRVCSKYGSQALTQQLSSVLGLVLTRRCNLVNLEHWWATEAVKRVESERTRLVRLGFVQYNYELVLGSGSC